MKTQHLIFLPVELAVEDQLSLEINIVYLKALNIVHTSSFKELGFAGHRIKLFVFSCTRSIL